MGDFQGSLGIISQAGGFTIPPAEAMDAFPYRKSGKVFL